MSNLLSWLWGNTMRLITLLVISLLFTGCSRYLRAPSVNAPSNNPLKTIKDLQIESALVGGTWKYERQGDDCEDTNWEQSFHYDRYYKSVGAACLLPQAFSVDAENWYTKQQILYITNLSPKNGDDIIMKYRIDFLDENKLVLSSGKFKYTFFK